MSIYVGDYSAGSTVYIYFNTFDSNDPSASVTMTNFANTDVHIHKNANLTQRNNAAGVTVDVDVDAITGCHLISIDTADNTVADFFVAGADYGVRIEGVTVDAATLNPFVGHFSIENRHVAGVLQKTTIATLASQTSFTLTAGSADDDAYNDCTIVVSDIASAIQKCVGRISDYTGITKTVTLVADPGIFTMAASDQVSIIATSALANVAAVGSTAQTAGDLAALVTTVDGVVDAILVDTGTTLDGAIATIDSNVDAILVDTGTTLDAAIATIDGNVDAILVDTAEIGAAGAGLTVLATAANLATVDTVVDSILVDTGTTLDAALAVVDANVDAILVDTGTTLDAALAVVDGNVDAILVDTADIQPKLGTLTDLGGGATLANNLSDMAGATFSTTTDTLEAIRDRGDAAWTTGAGGNDRLLLQETTIATLASQTSFTLDAGSADDDAYNGCTIVIEDVSTATQKAVGVVLDYTGITKTVTLLNDPAVFTMATTDNVYVLAEKSLKSTAINRQLDVTATGAAGIDWGNVENPTTALDLSATDIQLCDTTTTNTDMVGTDSAALASVCTEGRLAELDAANLPADVDSILVDTGTTLDAALAVVDSNVDAILVDTGTTLDAALAVVDANVDAILVDTGTTLDAALAVVDGNVDLILADTADMQPKLGTITDLGAGATVGNNLADMAGATFSSASDSQEAIRDRGDAAWTTGAGGSDRLLLVDTTIATLASQTSFTLAAGSADDDAYNNCTIVVEDVSTATQKAIGVVLDYTGSTKTVTLLYDPAIFTMATTDKVYVLAENALKTTAANRQLDVTATGTAGIDWGNVENPTTAVDLSATDIQLCDTVTTNTDMVGTDSAALASVCTEGRMAELDAANLPADVDSVLTDTADMQPKLGTITDLGAGATVANNLADMAGATFNAGTDSLEDTRNALSTVNGQTTAILFDTGTTLDGKINTIDSNVDAILLDTAEIGAAGAGLTDLGGMSTGMKAEVESEANDALVAANLDHLVTASGTSDSGSTTTMVDAARTEGDDDYWKGSWILFTSGTADNQPRLITGFTASSDTITFTPAATQAISTNTYVILPAARVEAAEAITGQVTADVTAISGDSTAADNAEAFFDGTGYAGTGNTIPTVTAVTNQVTADCTAISGDSTAADNLELDYDGTGYNKSNSTIGTTTTNSDMVGTNSAALASVCTEGRLAELDAGNLPSDVDAILTDTGTTLDAALAVVDGNVDAILVDTGTTLPSTLAALASQNVAILDDTDQLILQSTTITGLASQTVFNLVSGSVDDNAYAGAIVVVEDLSSSVQKSVGICASYTGSTKTVTLAFDPGTFTIADLDKVTILPGHLGLPTAKPDTAGGLPVSDAGGLDLDTLDSNVSAVLVDTAEIGAAGAGLTDLGGMSTAMKAEVNAEADTAISDAALATAANLATVDTVVDSILVDTGTTLDAALAVVDANVDAILVDTGTTLDAALAVVDGNVDSILVDTAEIGTAGAGLTDLGGFSTAAKAEINAEADTAISDAALATAASLATVDTVVDSILADTGTDGVQLASGQTVAWASALEASAGEIVEALVDTATNTHTPTVTEFQSDTITEATADHYNGRIVYFTSGVLSGQATDITDYAAVGGIGQFTVTAMTEAPSNNDDFIIV